MNKFYLFLCSYFLTLHSQYKHTNHTQIDHGSMKHEMAGMYGSYPMNREASGTSWVPDTSPMEGIYFTHKDWHFMFSGFSYLVYDKQAGIFGGKKVFDENMFMVMGHKKIDNTVGTLIDAHIAL